MDNDTGNALVQMWLGFGLTIGTIVFTAGVIYGRLHGEIKLIKYRLRIIEAQLRIPDEATEP